MVLYKYTYFTFRPTCLQSHSRTGILILLVPSFFGNGTGGNENTYLDVNRNGNKTRNEWEHGNGN